MRLFLIFAGHGSEMTPLVRSLKENGHEVVYWVGLSGGDEKEFPEIIFHDDFDAAKNIPALGVDIMDFLPPGLDLLEKLYAVESRVMTLFTKTEPNLDVEQRKRKYYEMFRYWYGLLIKYRPDAIVFPISPSQSYNYLIYSLAKFLGIKTIMFYDTWVGDRTLLQTEYENSGQRMLHEIQKNSQAKFTLSDLSADLQDYYKRYYDPSVAEPSPANLQKERKRNSGMALMRRKLRIVVNAVREGRIFHLVIGNLRKRVGPNPQKEYRSVQKTPDFGAKYVYVPLQFQPERSALALGSVFVDQLLTLEILASALPAGWQVYVKEHPTQWWRRGLNYSPYRPQGFYEKIAGLKNVSIVPIETDNYKLIKHSLALVTVTGTPGWEAIVRGKPVVIFGYPWYMDCPEVLRAYDVSTCSSALEKIASGEFQVNRQSVINYLKSLDNASIHLYVDDSEETISKYSNQERMNNMVQAILAELKGEYSNAQ